MAAQVMIELVPDASKVKGAIDQLEQTGGDVSAFKDGNAELQKRNQLLAQGLSTSEKIETQEKKQIATLGGLAKATGAVATEVIKISGADFAKAMQDQGKSADQLIKSLAGVTTEVKKEEAATKSLRAEKRALQEEIGRLIAAGQQESATFREMVSRAGEIDDAMKDASDAIRRTGSDTKGLDNALLVARGVTAGFTVMTGAAALFGNESEEVQKVLLRVNAAMAILNGLQEIQNILKSEYVKTLIASVTVTRAQTVATEGASVAQTGLNTAMSSNPIGAVIVALTTLIGIIALFVEANEDAERSQQELNAVLSDAQVQSDMNAINNMLSVRIALLNQLGSAQSEIMQAELSGLIAERHLNIERLVRLDMFIEKQKGISTSLSSSMAEQKQAEKDLAEAQKTRGELNTKIAEQNNAIVVKQINLETQRRNEAKKTAEEDKKNVEEAAKNAQTLSDKRIAANEKAEEKRIKAFEKVKEAEEKNQLEIAGIRLRFQLQDAEQKEKDAQDQKARMVKQGDDALALARRIAKAQQDLDTETFNKQEKEREDRNKAIYDAAIQLAGDIANTIFGITNAQRQAETDAQLAELEKQKDAALNTENLTKAQQKEIEKRYNRDVARIKTEAARKQRDADANAAYVNTLLAITNALATTKPFVPAALIAAATAFTTGMLQVARINSTPLPQYAKGGRNVPSGMALVGEQGPELIDLKGGEDIYTARDSARMMHEWVMPDHSTAINKGAKSQGIDYDKLADAITKKMPRQPNVSLNADEHGFMIFVESENNRKTIRNQRYSTR